MLNISKGLSLTPPKVVIYGPEGIGKSTLAGKFPGALFVDLENGTGRLDVSRIEAPQDYTAFKLVLKEIAKEVPQDYHTLVLDTADKLDGMITQNIIDSAGNKNINGIEDFGYGKGYTFIEESWRKLLDGLTDFQKKTGWTVIFIAHATQRKIETVGQLGNFDHYELKLSKKASPLLKEWADFLFFVNYDVTLIKDKDNNKTKAVGGERVIYTNHSTYYDAKSRAPLPDSLELDAEGVKTIFRAIYPDGNPMKKAAPAPAPAAAPVPAPAPQPEITPEDKIHEEEVGCNIPPKVEEPPANSPADLGVKKDEPAINPKIQDYIKRIDNALTIDGFTRSNLEMVTVKMGMRPQGTPLEQFSEQDLSRIVNNWEKVIRNIKKLKEQ